MLALLIRHREGILDGLLHSDMEELGWHMSLVSIESTMLWKTSFLVSCILAWSVKAADRTDGSHCARTF